MIYIAFAYILGMLKEYMDLWAPTFPPKSVGASSTTQERALLVCFIVPLFVYFKINEKFRRHFSFSLKFFSQSNDKLGVLVASKRKSKAMYSFLLK